jgi:3-methyladenine DNA glycosylase AlkD
VRRQPLVSRIFFYSSAVMAKAIAQSGKKKPALTGEVDAAIKWLQRHSTKRTLDGMARYGIPSDNAFGVSVGDIRRLAKEIGRNHKLAVALWKTKSYEGRMLACFVDDPQEVTAAQMDRWCRDFDSWAICDTACFHLFDRTSVAWKKARQWSKSHDEFVKRAAFALMASLVVHDKTASDAQFRTFLPMIERGANDDRNFVKKAVNWALRTIGKHSPELNAAALAVAERLASSKQASPRWVGKDAHRELTSAAVHKRLRQRSTRVNA